MTAGTDGADSAATGPKAPRRPGSPWRILVHEWRGEKGRGAKYGSSHGVSNDARFGGGDASERAVEVDGEMFYRHGIELPGTEMDEVVIGRWLHLEQMTANGWWANIGGITLQIHADRDGRPKHVTVYGPQDYAAPIDGCVYSLSWDGIGFDNREYPKEAEDA